MYLYKARTMKGSTCLHVCVFADNYIDALRQLDEDGYETDPEYCELKKIDVDFIIFKNSKKGGS